MFILASVYIPQPHLKWCIVIEINWQYSRTSEAQIPETETDGQTHIAMQDAVGATIPKDTSH